MDNDQVQVNLDLVCCNGCGACAEACPEVFGYDQSQELPYLKSDRGPRECVREAAVYCPEDCIELSEDK